jgi:hypothetical protein
VEGAFANGDDLTAGRRDTAITVTVHSTPVRVSCTVTVIAFHTGLVREDRLMAGVFTLSELDEKLRQMCLLMETEGVGCTYDDAAVLAKYAGHVAGTNAFNAFVKQVMAG